MTKPTEHKSVQKRILKYADEIGWNIVSRKDAEKRRGFYTESTDNKESNPNDPIAGPIEGYIEKKDYISLYFGDILYEKIKEFNPKYTEEPALLIRKFNLLKNNIYGNKEFLNFLREKGLFIILLKGVN